MSPHRFLIPVIIAVFALPACPVWADVDVIQPFDMGRWIVKSNNAVESVTVNPDGSYHNTSGLTMLSPPQEGIFDIDGLPINTIISSVTVLQLQALDAGAGPDFSLDNFQVITPPLTTGAGHATISVGAQANTSGNGDMYPDAVYNGQLNLTFNH